ncbi:hypothetical protein ABE61_21220 [Lysinibacillus sphaericus]|uniref:DUF1648 domain-containing protein n=1 Tax=Lysinibacillus sphaericus TaxID=1421 RepID=UPI0018CDD61F|nr:DUF1648 domain-containing protein [Lysinibacillus sphaericus]MBG9456464.1 hypothetical protein [Lysinibacillus sphaericus]MBG9476538.1 hypothetical protein [Lysinibacillus sphaericus]MBG9594598.1 hypothetical protein [Lysinibacillus sphaericus]
MLFIISIFIFVGVLETLTPFLSRKTTVFGVSIPEPYVQHQKLQMFKKHYSMLVGGIAVAFLIGQILLLLTPIQEEKFVLLSFILLYVMLLISAFLYMFYHIKTKKLKKENWEAHVKTVYVTDLSIRDRDEALSPTFFALPIIVTLAMITFTYMNYNAIPDVIATRWNAAGEVDGWTEKTWISVIVMPLILLVTQICFFIMSFGMKSAKIQLSAQAKEASANRELKQRKYGSWCLAAINYSMTILLGVFHYTTVILKNQTAPYFFPLIIVFMIVSLGGFILFIWKSSENNERFDDLHSNETAAADDRYWKWGIFYINKNDPSLLVQKKYGVGWTANLANKWCYITLLVMFLPILLVTYI